MNSNVLEKLIQIPGWQNSSSYKLLSGGITNQNYLITLNSKPYVLRVYGAHTLELGIARDREIACHSIAAKLGLAPDIFFILPDASGIVTPYIEGKILSENELRDPHILSLVAKTLRTFHSGPLFPGQFSPFRVVREYYDKALVHKVLFPDNVREVIATLNDIEKSISSIVREGSCHNDLLGGNFIYDGEKIWMLDWEYAASGDLFFDLGNFSINLGLSSEQTQTLLREYFGTLTNKDVAHLELMKLASDMREAFWGFLQSAISEIEFDYTAYALKYYNRFQDCVSQKNYQEWMNNVCK